MRCDASHPVLQVGAGVVFIFRKPVLRSLAAREDVMEPIKILDLRYLRGTERQHKAFVDAYADGMRREGFVGLTHHDLPPDTLREAYEKLRAFFRLPLETRLRYHLPWCRGQRGYVPFGIERYDGGKPELKEHFNWGETTAHPMFAQRLPTNLWPREIWGFQEFFQNVFWALHRQWADLRRTLAESAGQDDFLLSTSLVDDSLMRLLRYPPLSELDTRVGLRAGEHFDTGFLTLLVAASGPGLQLEVEDGWVDVPADPDVMITNGGKMMRYVAPVFRPRKHRVIVVPGQEECERFAIAFFGQPAPWDKLWPVLSLYQEIGEDRPPLPIEAWRFLDEDLRRHHMRPPGEP